MKNTDEKWLRSLERRLRNYSKPLPENDWEDFASRAFPKKKEEVQRILLYKKSLWKWMKIAAVLVLLLLPSTFVWLYLGQHSEIRNRVVKMEERKSSLSTLSSIIGPAVVVDSTLIIKKDLGISSSTAKVIITKSKEKKKLLIRENEITKVSIDKDEKKEFTNVGSIEQDSIFMHLPSSAVVETDFASTVSINKHYKKTLGKVLGGTLGAIGSGVLASSLSSIKSGTEDASLNSGTFDAYLKSSFIYVPMKMKTPKHLGFGFSTGVSLREPLSEHLALDQNIFFQFGNWKNDIGLNLKLVWEIWQNKHWGIYLSSGPSYQFHLQNKIFDHKGLFSVQLSPGLQYNITKHFGLYAEPNINWFLNKDNHVDYGFHHFLPGTQTGFRFSF